ncbi:hypothetical protein MYA_4324 [Burkholderia sp. KJ006]|nr:hypothetical protein MYA_4324 [Burkholderia sp. KJ006]
MRRALRHRAGARTGSDRTGLLLRGITQRRLHPYISKRSGTSSRASAT